MSMASGAGALLIGVAGTALAACGGPLRAPLMQPGNPAVRAAAGPEAVKQAGAIAPPDRPVRLAGRLDAHNGRPLLSGAVILISMEDGMNMPAPLPAQDVTIRADGTFEFRNVPPGRYEIRARGETEPDGTSLFGTFRVIADGRDIENANLALVPGARLSGKVIVERVHSQAAPGLDGVLVRAPLADGSSFGDAVTGQVRDGGAFAIRGLMEGSHVIRVEGLPESWVLKSVLYKGQDITDTGFESVPQQQFADVRVTITDAATDVSGTVRDAQGNPGGHAVIVIAPLSPQFWTRTSRRLAVLRSDAAGRYRIRGLPAGEYRVIASMDVDEAGALRPAVLRQVAATGAPLRLAALETRTLDLPLTPPAGPASEP